MLTPTIHRSLWIDNARVIATLAVIIVHVATPGVVTDYKTAIDLRSGWSIANAYDSISRFCVPVFVMLTGALLVPQTISLRDFINKRFKRLLMPFLFWSVVFCFFTLL
jgi:surface polysaccharide O-acyltransferase-like enzyme